VGSYEDGNKSSACIKCAEFLDLVRSYQVLMKDSAPWSYLTISLIYLNSVHLLLLLERITGSHICIIITQEKCLQAFSRCTEVRFLTEYRILL
jgi:hypothetical protein